MSNLLNGKVDTSAVIATGSGVLNLHWPTSKRQDNFVDVVDICAVIQTVRVMILSIVGFQHGDGLRHKHGSVDISKFNEYLDPRISNTSPSKVTGYLKKKP
jgi:hypothetical protein